jgi:hypothetical protein
MTFTPDTPFPFCPYVGGIGGRIKNTGLFIAGSAGATNDGPFLITGLVAQNDGLGMPTLAAVTYQNTGGAAGADATCGWQVGRFDRFGKQVDAWSRSYVNRGYRVWRGQSVAGERKAICGVLLILPYGTTAATRLSVRECLRQMKAAGFAGIVERRITAP